MQSAEFKMQSEGIAKGDDGIQSRSDTTILHCALCILHQGKKLLLLPKHIADHFDVLLREFGIVEPL